MRAMSVVGGKGEAAERDDVMCGADRVDGSESGAPDLPRELQWALERLVTGYGTQGGLNCLTHVLP